MFALAQRLAALAPGPLNHVFFTSSGSEAVDTAMKIVLAYHRQRGEGQRTRFISREKAYHGVGFGGMALGGLPNNRKSFALQLGGVDYLRHTLDLQRNAFSKGLPRQGAELADDLERLIALHDASTIAAVFVEPIAGSAGVILPAPGYLQRLRELCDQHRILLVFDEVITGFGRVGMPFAAQRFGVTPDLLTFAKAVSNGAVPLGGVLVADAVHAGLMQAPPQAIELFHGYTWSGHPLACAAALATLDVYAEERLFERAIELGEYWQQRLHALQGLPNVIDIRNFGLVGAVELAPRRDAPGSRGYEVYRRCFHDGQAAGALHRRHHRAVAAADRGQGADRPDHRHPGRDDPGHRLSRAAWWRAGTMGGSAPARCRAHGYRRQRRTQGLHRPADRGRT